MPGKVLDPGVRESVDDMMAIDREFTRFPFSIVWTPIPFLTWFCPLLGHVGIGTSEGIIRDFSNSYCVNEDYMAFGEPTKYWQLSLVRMRGGVHGWDRAVRMASEIYSTKIYLLFFDNCHSHVATALNLMHYNESQDWDMKKVVFNLTMHAKYVSTYGALKSWLPFFAVWMLICLVILRFVYKVI